jgi:hypothetical protein
MTFSMTFDRSRAALALFAGASLAFGAPAFAQDEKAGDAPKEEPGEESAPKEMTKGEKELAKLLEGRVAGEPRSCINHRPTQRSRTIDKTAYVYGSGNTIYVQRTKNPRLIDDREVLVTQRFGGTSQLCRQDIARVVDPVSGIFAGAVFFDDFIPYTRVKDKDDS